jgi:hypothetical protein
MTFSLAPWKENELHDINSQQSFEALPLKPNGQIKNMGAHDRNHPIQQSSGIYRSMNFAGRAFRNPTIHPNWWEQHPTDLQTWCEKNRRTTTFILRRRRNSPHAAIRRPTTTKEVQKLIIASLSRRRQAHGGRR